MQTKTIMDEKEEKAKKSLELRGEWSEQVNELPKFLLSFGLVVGIALVVLGNFATGLGATTAGNTVNNVIGYFNSGLVTFGYILIIVVFAGAIIWVLKETKIIG